MTSVHARPQEKIHFEIHDEEIEESEPEQALSVGDEQDLDEEPNQEDETLSDTSEESEDHVDSSVQEDMDKFQETFKGIKNRFRLINRIGEGLDSLITHDF